MRFEPIGIIRSPITETIDHSWGEVESDIQLHDSLADGLKKLDQFSHATIIFHMDQAPIFKLKNDLVRRPQGRLDMPKIGIFAQRAKHRPNPIGMTVVQIISIKKNIMRVKGLDAIDGTPVLDIKPYFPIFDCINSAKTPKWVDELMKDYF